MAKLHIPAYMLALSDPVDNLLRHVETCSPLLSLHQIHKDKKLMSLAEKVTQVLHEVYPTEGKLGLLVDRDEFSFVKDTTPETSRQALQKKRRMRDLVKLAGARLFERLSFIDNLIEGAVQPRFEAKWFRTEKTKFDDGPLLVYLPKEVEQHALGGTHMALQDENEKSFDCKLLPATTEEIANICDEYLNQD